MTIIDNIMALADQYATQRQHAHYLHETDARQTLRATIALALALTPGEPVAVGYTLDDIAYACVEAEIPDSKFESLSIALEAAAPQPHTNDTALLRQALDALEYAYGCMPLPQTEPVIDAIAALKERLK